VGDGVEMNFTLKEIAAFHNCCTVTPKNDVTCHICGGTWNSAKLHEEITARTDLLTRAKHKLAHMELNDLREFVGTWDNCGVIRCPLAAEKK
jgi:hypothetical protein